ncbi:unnamed protein product [Cunninghamella blakesleeana]
MIRVSIRLWCSIALLFYLVTFVLASTVEIAKTTISIPTKFRNTKVLQEIAIRIKNIDSNPVAEYYGAFPSLVDDKIASISAVLRQEPKTPLSVEKAGFDSEKEHQLYKITFDEPLQADQDIRITLKVSYTHSLKPLPAKIPQVARQLLMYKGNVFFFSPYDTDEVKTTIVLPSTNIVSFTGGENVQQKGSKLVYGPFHNIPSESFQPLDCHFESSNPLITITYLERDLQVSHWGNNLAVEEHYHLRNDGAELNENFSRSRYMLSSQIHSATNLLKSLTLRLPALATDVYYRDEIGNVSTSNFRYERDSSVLSIRPRYPVFGGWNYNWYHGYNAPLSSFLRYFNDEYILNVNFVENTKDMSIDKVRVQITLPEGASDVKVHTPFKLDLIEHSTLFTNFDSTGRYLVILEKQNVVQDYEKPIQITYKYSTYHLLQKPLVASFALLLLFTLSVIVSKLPVYIGKKKKSSLKSE